MFALIVLAVSVYAAYAVVRYLRKGMRHANSVIATARKEFS